MTFSKAELLISADMGLKSLRYLRISLQICKVPVLHREHKLAHFSWHWNIKSSCYHEALGSRELRILSKVVIFEGLYDWGTLSLNQEIEFVASVD